MRRAFVMGSNGPSNLDPLQYALKDAANIRTCLAGSRCGFEVVSPEAGSDVFALRQKLYNIAESCQENDTFVCYFSGHGFLEKGSLFLLWDNSQIERLLSTALPVDDITLALQYCKAQNKLLILDCCHAGAVVNAVGFKDAAGVPVEEIGIKPRNYLVLMAAERFERARELKELQGSFLTAKLCAALDTSFHAADLDGDGMLSIADLKSWLEQETKYFNQFWHKSSPVPTPYFFGQQKGDFFLTLNLSNWRPYEIEWPDGTQMVVLPIRPQNNFAICLGKNPVTNAQYQKLLDAFPADPVMVARYQQFLEEFPEIKEFSLSDRQFYFDFHSRHQVSRQYRKFLENPLSVPCQEPVGLHYQGPPIEDKESLSKARQRKELKLWQENFHPWREEGFREPDKSVVCVTVREAAKYCAWINMQLNPPGKTFLPNTTIWDFAAFGKPFPVHSSNAWLSQMQKIHRQPHPSAIDKAGTRGNNRGVCDLFGVVWQWCLAPIPMHTHSTRDVLAKLRGGGFMSDLAQEEPYWDAAYLDEGEETRRSDIGFRIAGRVPLYALPEHVRVNLSVCQPIDYMVAHE